MCQYAGGKAKLGKRISSSILKYEYGLTGSNNSPYFEPFVGMGGVLKYICEDRERQIFACDKEKCIPSFWRGIQEGWTPPEEMDKETYKSIRSGNVENELYAFSAYGCSFKGMRWAGFYQEAFDIATKRLEKNNFKEIVKNVHYLDPSSYIDHDPHGMTIYCDPPYKKCNFIAIRKNLLSFDTDMFWETMRKWSLDNIVIVSETEAPDDFIPIWTYVRMNGITQNGTIEEKLFVLK